MAHTNDDLRESEKGAVETTAQETDAVMVDNKEALSSHEGLGSETPSEGEVQTAVMPDNDPTSEPPSEAPIESTGAPTGAYSVFTVTQKKMIVLTASLASLFSPMATAIYYPSLTIMAKDLHVSDAKINLTVTLFLVIQGIAPAFFADIADRAGRRPIYAICYLIFNIANIGLALQTNYTALLILRMVQSAGSSSTVSLANGVVGDIITSAERGTYIAFSSLAGIFGPMIAPVLGGAIAQYAGWHFLFWFQLIFSSAVYVPLLLFMPETCRAVVDDGSIPPPRWSRNFTDTIRHRNRARRGLVVDKVKQEQIRERYRIGFPNPLATLRVVSDKATAIILICTGVGIGCFYAISTGAATAFNKHYNFNPLQISLMFIPIGAGSILSALISGRLIDWNYRRHAKRLGITVVKNQRQDLRNFPIESARLQVGFPILFLAGAAVMSYGWAIRAGAPLAAPIVVLFVAGFALTFTFQVLNVLLVDMWPGKAAVATSANNLVRCEIGAVFTGVIGPLTGRVGEGWAYTILAAGLVGVAPVLVVVMRRGVRWRGVRREREERKEGVREEKREREAADRRVREGK
ncbi:hypothetical protein VE02_00083 [Pseudogymnoascus sp. 03VT05]|nr:hypothetical protein VE02_00083 [Pseudogymnoascus sp. 03VT05]